MGKRAEEVTKQQSSWSWVDLFKKRAEGQCFRYLAPDHCVAECRDH
jgi:hypothetical protein